ncbi:hypothetical protein [Coralliovum pocilloporae]|uniref:hypothetical protein n=1 Tax=Coralliovum pocilloporae TaxID=3066369 RepID=UPI00330773D6
MINIPLMIAPLIVFNLFAFGFLGEPFGDPWLLPVFTVTMVSEARWTLTVGDILIVGALVLLFIEILKATRTGAGSILDHMLSTLVFIAFLVEFLLVGEAANSVFFILMIIALIDVVAGYSVTIRSARRDFSVGPGGDL